MLNILYHFQTPRRASNQDKKYSKSVEDKINASLFEFDEKADSDQLPVPPSDMKSS